ncbi:membrane-spanning 4-domains subfamily A member 15-like isoform 2-T2 [Pholidichthys leucotaenia]
MSAQLYTGSETGGKNQSLQGTRVGGTKPLHRFIKGQPKAVGIVVLVLGSSIFVVSAGTVTDSHYTWAAISPSFVMGTLFIISGILYILTEHNPTKKKVTASLALSIVSIMAACYSMISILPDIGYRRDYDHFHHYSYTEFSEDNTTIIWNEPLYYTQSIQLVLEVIFVFYSMVGGIIFIVMSALAGTALRSTNSRTVVVMTAAPTETAIE